MNQPTFGYLIVRRFSFCSIHIAYAFICINSKCCPLLSSLYELMCYYWGCIIHHPLRLLGNASMSSLILGVTVATVGFWWLIRIHSHALATVWYWLPCIKAVFIGVVQHFWVANFYPWWVLSATHQHMYSIWPWLPDLPGHIGPLLSTLLIVCGHNF